MDIYERLKQDHEKLRHLANEILETEGKEDRRQQLWQEYKTQLKAHAAAEEQVFYTDLMAKPDATDQIRHSVSEHNEADELAEKIDEMDMSSGGWIQSFKKLKEEVEHHMEEEEQDVFALSHDQISDSRAERMSDRFDDRKQAELEEQRQ